MGDTRVSKVMGSFSSPDMAIHAFRRRDIDRKANGHADQSRDEADDGKMMSKDIIEPPEVESRPSSPGPATGGQFGTEDEECDVCGRPTNRPCSWCSRGRFCSHKCEDDMSPWHLAKRSRREMTTADELVVFVSKDRLPPDKYVDLRNDFGFSRCRSEHEERSLLGLYKGLMILEVSARKLDAWRKDGQLTTKIHKLYTQIPEGSGRRGYYPWFQRHEHVLDPSRPLAKRCEDLISWLIEEARPYLSPEDRGFQELGDLQPPEKAVCFWFYAQALQATPPNPADGFDLWYGFGFCTCRNGFEENGLASAYSVLFGGDRLRGEYDKELGVPYERRGPSCLLILWKSFGPRGAMASWAL